MDWKKIFESKNTEEIRPNLFLKKTKKGNYYQVYPLRFNGRWMVKNFLWPPYMKWTVLMVTILVTVALSHKHDVAVYTEALKPLYENPIKYCNAIIEEHVRPICTEQLEKFGLCDRINFSQPVNFTLK